MKIPASKILATFLYLSSACSLTLQAQDILDIPFQVYLWSDPDKTERAEAKFGRKATDGMSAELPYVPPVIQYSPDGPESESVSIRAEERRLSPTYRYKGTSPLVLFREIPSAEGKPRRIPLASTKLSSDLKRALLILYPTQNQSGPKYQIFTIDNSLERTPRGTALIYNLSRKQIALAFNQQKILIAPGKSAPAQLEKSDDYSILLQIGSENETNQWEIRHIQRLIIDPNDSILLLIYTLPGKNEKFRIMTLENPNEALLEPVESP
ncbi:MAG: hypothetical protein ACQKBT_03825 [Puniceicoccales bacterium]